MKSFTAWCYSQGLNSVCNQDSITIQQILLCHKYSGRRENCIMAVVCDGVGGMKEGEIASGYATKQCIKWFYSEGVELMHVGKSARIMKKALLRLSYQIHHKLQVYGIEKKLLLGTTFTFLLLTKRHFYLVHSGDSRCYGWRAKKLLQLTTDHRRGNYLARCLGNVKWQRPDVIKGRIRGLEGFLLCSDGFYKLVKKQEIELALQPGKVTQEKRATRILKEIRESLVRRGEQDDISAIYIHIRRERKDGRNGWNISDQQFSG